MTRTNYDEVAPTYDQRYARNRYPGVTDALLKFAGKEPHRVLEVACGSGHWLALLAANGHNVAGIDASAGMLAKAKAKLPQVPLVNGEAEALPFKPESFDRVVIINAVHHFSDPRRALSEARRVLSASGAVLLVGLDPQQHPGEWSIYDFFRGTRERDRARFPPMSSICEWLRELGFERCDTFVAERIEQDVSAREALANGLLARHVTSQLSELSDAAYAAGIAAIERAAAAAEAVGETLQLHSRMQLFATVAESLGGHER
jgi:ubiquinone/menaquinone biosynthesis C-methylase UbiE